MNNPREQKMRLILNGAVSLYEGECLEIPSVLMEQKRQDLAEAYDAIGTALYWMKQEIEKKEA